MNVYRREPVIETLAERGEQLRRGLNAVIDRHGLAANVKVVGPAPCMVLTCLDPDGQPSQGYRTLMLQELIRRGVLAPSLVVSYSHSPADIEATVEAVDGALTIYARALEDGYQAHLVGRPSKVVYRKFN